MANAEMGKQAPFSRPALILLIGISCVSCNEKTAKGEEVARDKSAKITLSERRLGTADRLGHGEGVRSAEELQSILESFLREKEISVRQFSDDSKEMFAKIGRRSEGGLLTLLADLQKQEAVDDSFIAAAYVGLANYQPERALDFFIEEARKKPKTESYFAALALETIAKQIPEDLISAILHDAEVSGNYDFCQSAIKSLLTADAGRAKELATRLDILNGRSRYLSLYYRFLSGHDIESAFQQVNGESPQKRSEALISMASYSMDTNPRDSIRALRLSDRHPSKKGMILEAYQKHFALDSGAAAKQLLEEGPIVLNAVFKNPTLVNEIARLGLDRTAEIIEKLPYLGGNSDRFQSVALALVEKEPVRVMAWIESFPEGPERSEILKAAMDAFTSHDPEAAKAYALSKKE